MSVKTDLIAARALIDTPDKLNRSGIVGSLERACAERFQFRPALNALEAARIPPELRDHEAVMATFDRAIEAAE